MNFIYHHDFRLLKDESLKIDYLRWNLKPLDTQEMYQLASFFKSLGFNSYQKERDTFKRRDKILYDESNKYEVVFILQIRYKKGTHIEFSGENARKIFECIKTKRFKWNIFKDQPSLGRIDIIYDRKSKPTP